MAPAFPIDFAGQKESRKHLASHMMGKARKHIKGHSSGFVPDFRHAVETMAESEGLGSSGRIDRKMTASENSCAPKRKCISLNVDSCDSFGGPMQVLSLSKMSRTERKNLELKLKTELDEVRVVQKKVDSLISDVVMLSPSSDIRSCSDGQKKSPLHSLHMSADVIRSQGKKRPPGRNGARMRVGAKTKVGANVRPQPVAGAVPKSSSHSILMKQCESLLTRLMGHKDGWVFNNPVDVVKLKIPDYFTVIKHPMDFGTIKAKMAAGNYSPLDFAADIRLTLSNAMTYNPPKNDVHLMAQTLSQYFEMRWKAIEKKLPTVEQPVVLSRSSAHMESETSAGTLPPLKKKKVASNDSEVRPEPVRLVMSNEEKVKLSRQLESLLEDLPENIVDFLRQNNRSENQTEEDEIEIDIDTFSDETMFKLRKLLDDYLLEKPKSQSSKVDPHEAAIISESGVNNSNLRPGKGTDPVDEDVDILGGNDPPVSSYPPVEIEKDVAHENSKCSSSSSSSSESGSSDSECDSGSELDPAKASLAVNSAKGTMISADHRRSDAGVQDTENQSLNDLGQSEVNFQSNPNVVEAEDCQDGETAPSGRQISPEKLYRAALIRNRFADTILKAREKALEKGEKQDPEKLRIEREELEKRQREEKARLQAEAKAAEEARRRAEAEAAAEVRKRRELDREAARQKLQKMEKTVDINENSQFMEDLEMLTAANDEHVPSFEEQASPDQNILGSFKLQGSNPLEQLGLYMKMDEDDEEEVEVKPPQCVPEDEMDVEDGQIE